MMTEEAATAKRKEIAASIREDAAKLEGSAKLLRLMESLYYSMDDAAAKANAKDMATTFITSLDGLAADKLEARKGEAMQLNSAMQYLVKAKVVSADSPNLAKLAAIIKTAGWDKKK